MQDLSSRGNTIKALENVPEIEEHEVFYWNAFTALCASRPSGFSLGAIPLSEMLAYCELVGLDDPDERLEFVSIMQSMDEAFLEYKNKVSGKGGKK